MFLLHADNPCAVWVAFSTSPRQLTSTPSRRREIGYGLPISQFKEVPNAVEQRSRIAHANIRSGWRPRSTSLSAHTRSEPAVPFGGVYFLIDFTLSNCFNSGLRRIYILTQYQCDSLYSYVQTLAPQPPIHCDRDEFLLCLCPAGSKRYRGTADAVFQNLPLLEKTRPEFVVILSGDHVYRMDYRDLLQFHSDSDADVTIAGVECRRNAASEFGVLETDSEEHVVGFEEKPNEPKPIFAKPSKSLVNMGVYVFNTQTLLTVLFDDARKNTTHDFGKDIIPSLVRSNRVSVYNFTEKGTRLGSYWRDVGTVDAYYRAHMELLLSPSLDPYDGADWPLHRLDGHSRHRQTDRSVASALDSVIYGEPSLGRGSRVVHSVLSPGVHLERYANVHNSILLPNVQVGIGARIQRAILDENVHIADGVEIGYHPNRDREYGLVTESGVVVIPANTYVGGHKDFAPPHAAWRTELISNRSDQVPAKRKNLSSNISS